MTDYPALCPAPVARAVMLQRWDSLAYVHWPYPPDVVQAVLPPGLEADTFDGAAWVGLIPFHMQDVRPPKFPKGIPWIGTFPETNVRTYVRGPDGRPGVYFLSLDITRLAAVAVARLWYRLPYCWAEMSIVRADRSVQYASRRRWPRTAGATSRVAVEIGAAIEPAAVDDLENFLTARWGLWTVLRRGPVYAPVEHEPWPLYHAGLREVDTGIIVAAGLPAPRDEPHVRYSPGVDVRIGMPERAPVR